jgi:hypothetical protein
MSGTYCPIIFQIHHKQYVLGTQNYRLTFKCKCKFRHNGKSNGENNSSCDNKKKPLGTYRSREDVMRATVEEEGAADLRVGELDAAHLPYTTQ